jgi:hypothetical protein
MKQSELVIFSRGRHKTGDIMNVSTVPARCCPKGVPCASGGCYALKAYRRYPDRHQGWVRNDVVAKSNPDSYFSQIAARMSRIKPRFFRWHVAGDILSADYLRGMCKIAQDNPKTLFLAFTKAYSIVNQYEGSGQEIPSNLTVIFSAWPGLELDNPHGHRVAWLQDGTETRIPENCLWCPGNCETCGMCYDLPKVGRDVIFDKR